MVRTPKAQQRYTFICLNGYICHMIKKYFFALLIVLFTSCGKTNNKEKKSVSGQTISYARGLGIDNYGAYTIISITNPWPNANKIYRYALAQHLQDIPDSLAHLPQIKIPIKKIVVTSTTHLPSLEMLGQENSLKGFPMLQYISSTAFRKLINQNKIQELGSNQSINVEALINISPDVLIGYGINQNNPTLDKIAGSGIKVVLNGDWNEETPLGKAEWIKLFGALYNRQKMADSIFKRIEQDYNNIKNLAKKTIKKPNVMAGSIFQNKWYMPRGNSWGAYIIKDAGGRYLFANTTGTGSLSLPTEQLLAKADFADIWIGPEMNSLKEMAKANPHYAKFRAFQQGNVYNFTGKKGITGGVLYYELGPNRPDLVLKDVVKILHPDLLPEHDFYFFQKLQ